jgi:hypothetical protein
MEIAAFILLADRKVYLFSIIMLAGKQTSQANI